MNNLVNRVLSGATVRVFLNGAPFGEVISFTHSSQTPKKRIYVVDQVEAAELAPTVVIGTGALQLYRLSSSGGLEGAGATVHYIDVPREKYFSLTIIDRRSGMTIFHSKTCSAIGQNWSYPTRQLVTGTLQFEYTTWANELPAQAEVANPKAT